MADRELVNRVYDKFVDRWYGYIDISVRPRDQFGSLDDVAELRKIIVTILDAAEEESQ